MNNNIEAIPDGKFAPEDWEYILLQMVNDHSGVDFSMYRMATFRRRYFKRMNAVSAEDIRDYVKSVTLARPFNAVSDQYSGRTPICPLQSR